MIRIKKKKSLPKKIKKFLKNKARIRKKVEGTAERPRLNVFRSQKHIYAQLIDDDSSKTLESFSSLKIEEKIKGQMNVARKVGEMIAKKAKDKKIETVVFDRGGYLYHGRVKSLADGAREAGLKF